MSCSAARRYTKTSTAPSWSRRQGRGSSGWSREHICTELQVQCVEPIWMWVSGSGIVATFGIVQHTVFKGSAHAQLVTRHRCVWTVQ